MSDFGPDTFYVRSGKGGPVGDGFDDVVDTATRTPKIHSGWRSVTYKGKRYQLRGGFRNGHYINLSNPL